MALLCCMMAFATSVMAQTKADDIVGTYKAVQNGVNSKVKIFKVAGGYRAQVIWVDNLKKEDGSIRTDEKNPDKSKRGVRADQIVLVDKVTFQDGEWTNGKIYDPTRGKTFKVCITFKDAKTLKVKGSWGPFSESVYWTKL